MKITLPRIVRERVGTAYTYPGVDRIYFADDRPNVYEVSEGKARPIYEPRLQYETVFDYDFRIAQRAVAAGRLTLFVSTLAFITPLALVYVAGAFIGSGIERLADAIGSLNDRAGVRAYGIRSTIARLAREAFSL